ncbi:MAG: hypothetical protein ABIY56_12080 [Dokdonella sp.]
MKTSSQGKSWLIALCLGISLLVGGMAQARAATINVSFEWVDDRPASSTGARVITLFHHDGSFDLYDQGKPASRLLAKLLNNTATQADVDEVAPGVLIGSLLVGDWFIDMQPFAGLPPDVAQLDPVQHRFLTVFIPVLPSNDAFIANEDPYRIELFDLNKDFKGPKVVSFYGNDVMDAGVCVNDEARLYILDTWNQAQQQCAAEDGVVRWHPGFNGSWRNPDALPQRILGGSFEGAPGGTRLLDLQAADFTRPGARIGRLVIRADGASLEAASGSWYDPARSGEGFNVEYFRRAGSNLDEVLVYWYTYQPDGSGKPLWLVGGGEVGKDLTMYSMSGGKFASLDNPTLATRALWGSIQLSLSPCGDTGSVSYAPVNSAFPAGNYPLRRLSPRSEAQDWLCRLAQPDPLRLSE